MYTSADLMNYAVRISLLSKAQKEFELVNKQREYCNAVATPFSGDQQSFISAQLMALHGALEADLAASGQYGEYGAAANAYASSQVQSQLSHAHPQGQPRVASRNSRASPLTPTAPAFTPTSINQPVGVKTATTAAAGKTVGGLWFPPGNGPQKKGGLGTLFTTPAKRSSKTHPRADPWIATDYELTGKWCTLSSEQRTPPHVLRLARLSEKAESVLTPEERYELEVAAAGDAGPFSGDAGEAQGGLNYGNHGQPQQQLMQHAQQHPQQHLQQFNSFGAAVAAGLGPPAPQPPIRVHANDPNGIVDYPTPQEASQMGWMRNAPG